MEDVYVDSGADIAICAPEGTMYIGLILVSNDQLEKNTAIATDL